MMPNLDCSEISRHAQTCRECGCIACRIAAANHQWENGRIDYITDIGMSSSNLVVLSLFLLLASLLLGVFRNRRYL